MANTITDNRTLVHAADVVTPYDSLAGTAAGTLDTEIFIQGTGSIGGQISSSLAGILYDAGTPQDWSNNTFYIRINCGIVGLLATKAAGGFRIRFAGNTVTDYFEVYVGGSDEWPTAIAGGWVTFVVDITLARSTAVTNGWTGGTPPANTAIRYVGWAGITGGTMPRMVDNTWIDAIYRLPSGTAGILIQGRNGGTTPWTFADIFTQLGLSSGVFVPAGAGGGWVCNTPIQVGINDTTTHAFADSVQTVLWQDQEYAGSTLYGFTLLGGASGSTSFTLGVKSGSGDAATGAQGCTISADAAGVRWFLDADDANVNTVGLYGCQFAHGSDFQLDTAAVETISCLFLDCSTAAVANSLFQRNSVIDANTADGTAFCTTDDLTDIRFCTFEFSDGHAVELTTPQDLAQESRGNQFVGYSGTPGTNNTASSGSTDAAIYNNQGNGAPTDDVVISVTNSGNTPSIRNGADITTTVVNNVSITVDFSPVTVAEVRVYLTGTSTQVDGIENTAGSTFAFSIGAGVAVDIVVIKIGYEYFRRNNISFAASQTFPVPLRVDRNNPA